MPLVPNYPADHEKAGQSKARKDYSPGEIASHIRETVDNQRQNLELFRPVDRVALNDAVKLAEKLGDKGLIESAAAMVANVEATEVMRGARAAAK
jgi:hypothetical protein